MPPVIPVPETLLCRQGTEGCGTGSRGAIWGPPGTAPPGDQRASLRPGDCRGPEPSQGRPSSRPCPLGWPPATPHPHPPALYAPLRPMASVGCPRSSLSHQPGKALCPPWASPTQHPEGLASPPCLRGLRPKPGEAGWAGGQRRAWEMRMGRQCALILEALLQPHVVPGALSPHGHPACRLWRAGTWEWAGAELGCPLLQAGLGAPGEGCGEEPAGPGRGRGPVNWWGAGGHQGSGRIKVTRPREARPWDGPPGSLGPDVNPAARPGAGARVAAGLALLGEGPPHCGWGQGAGRSPRTSRSGRV